MDQQILTVALALGVRPAAVEAALRRGPGRARVLADLLGLTLGELIASVEPLLEAGVPLHTALDLALLRESAGPGTVRLAA